MLRGLYNWTMEKAAHRHAVGWLAFFSFVESSFFPIPPHPLLGLMCLAEPKKAVRYAAVATAASVAGALLGYAIGYFLYDAVGAQLIAALGLTESFPTARCTLNEYGAQAVILAAATPVPFKLLTITAGFTAMPLATFLIASIVGRAMIFMTVGILFRVFGAPIKLFIDKYLISVTTAFVVLVIGGFIALSSLAGESDEPSDDPCVTAARAGSS
ncbi:YqaA family protein [Allopontixanthobacter sp.]|uniref:YqaA family protein n=1 Tax=Allopontixanthobacter sp. TaxID=2906452 RepID=UPI002AB98403|nr:VTT domain-containing protein [Allopontixanthobacter sp.]MDZ4308809.1 VTT domain-containing protein [Allopontixanthobacter sp.]